MSSTAVLNNTQTNAAPDTAIPDLTVADRCDSCGAQAFFKASNASDLILLFCGHHGRINEPGLIAKGFTVLDQTHRINKEASASSA